MKQTAPKPIGLVLETDTNEKGTKWDYAEHQVYTCPICGAKFTFSNSSLDRDSEISYAKFQKEIGIETRIQPRCDACVEKELADKEEERRVRKEKHDEEIRLSNIQKRLDNSGIGERFIGMSWDDYKPVNAHAEKVFAECQNFVLGFMPKSGNSLLFIGSPGTGKNMLSAIIGQELIENGYTFHSITAMKLIRRIKASWQDKTESEQDVIDMFVQFDLLAIDEVGVQFGSPTEQLFLTEIINERYEQRKPTILISNLTLTQLEDIMGKRVIDRFYDDGSKFLVLNWQSYRRKRKAV